RVPRGGSAMQPLRVIQCGTGVAGSQALRGILQSRIYKLVGLLVHTPANAGRDAGSFVGLAPTGVMATASFEEILALEADVLCYIITTPDLNQICRLLASGKNVVTPAGMVFPAGMHPTPPSGSRRPAVEADHPSIRPASIRASWTRSCRW